MRRPANAAPTLGGEQAEPTQRRGPTSTRKGLATVKPTAE